MRSRRNVTLVFGARGHLGQSGCEDPVESLESCLSHARLASRRTTQSSVGGDPEGHPCRAYTVSYFKHETSSRISYLEIYLSSPNREAVDGANLVLAARLEEDRTGSAWADAARLGTGISRAARLATGGDAARLATGETRLGYTGARRGFTRGRGSSVSASGARALSGSGFVRRLEARAADRLRVAAAGDGWARIEVAPFGSIGATRLTELLGSTRLTELLGSTRLTELLGYTDRLDRSDATRLGYPPDRSGAASAVFLRSKRRGGSCSAGGCGLSCRRAEDGSASTRLADARWVGSTTGGSEG
ncbi:hypothetical protein E6C27_scaffold243G006060 [Cucumis melo var. makuwa]|uniref:Uncharacterized protein n=1 Tax=Cucumis melo var. makuwa TaxID=1194695 RepID=A0A5A7TXA2_CUCMM|nr:hypothetical protein E6C27_scaffold243G006060 [Cucumis melo var. makuwa]